MIRPFYISLLVTLLACKGKSVKEKNNMSTYNENHRLQFHFSPPEKWMNDPNGMVYHNGEYHLFYQYYPDSTVWGPMHWGHAVSKDLNHWEHLPIAIYPDSLGYIFSGSAVVDKKNTSGFGTLENPPLVAIYTYHDPLLEKQGSELFQTQGIAYSTDNGRTWLKYGGNPVLENPGIRDFRDPKVFWMEKEQKWIMALAVKDRIGFYSSADLKTWDHESDFGTAIGAHGGVWECPDLFQLENKWVLLVSINPGGPNGGSATQYFIGDFDGKTFTPQDENVRWLDYGRDNYAGVTWSDIPQGDGRRIFIGWMSNWDYANVVPTENWRSAMTVPRVLSLGENSNGFIIRSTPSQEFDNLHDEEILIEATSDSLIALNKLRWTQYDLNISLKGEGLSSKNFALILSNDVGDELKMGFNASAKSFYINRDKAGNNQFSPKFDGIQEAPFVPQDPQIKLRLIVDVGSVELFVNEGELAMTSLFFPQQPLNKTEMRVSESDEINVSGKIYKVAGIWK